MHIILCIFIENLWKQQENYNIHCFGERTIQNKELVPL